MSAGAFTRLRRATLGREASDFLSPILVKEVRQGVRGNAFTGALLLLQSLLALSMLLALALSGAGAADELATALFWGSVTIPALVILPLSGLRALSSEREAGTLEPILLTRLSPVRIVAGKWAALAAQVALLFSSVLPFVLLRYFLGGVDLDAELWLLLELLASSTLFSALTVALSASRLSNLFRLLVAAGVALPVYSIGRTVVANAAVVSGGLAVPLFRVGLLWLLTLLILLALGATALAAESESGSAGVRLLALAAALVGIWTTRDGAVPGELRALLGLWCAVVMLMALVAGLVEDRHRHPILDAPFFGHGRARLAAGLLLARGWPAGAFYAAFAAAAVCASAWSLDPRAAALWSVAGLAALLQPLALTQAFAPRTRRRGGLYVAFVVAAAGASFASGLTRLPGSTGLEGAGALVGAASPLGYLAQNDGLWRDRRMAGLADLVFVAASALSITGALVPAGRALAERRRRLRPTQERPNEALDGAAEA